MTLRVMTLQNVCLLLRPNGFLDGPTNGLSILHLIPELILVKMTLTADSCEEETSCLRSKKACTGEPRHAGFNTQCCISCYKIYDKNIHRAKQIVLMNKVQF